MDHINLYFPPLEQATNSTPFIPSKYISGISREFTVFLSRLNHNFLHKKYRKVIEEMLISSSSYSQLKEFYLARVIMIDSILRIIEKKIIKYPTELIHKHSKQRATVNFWFNEAYHYTIANIEDLTNEKSSIEMNTIDNINQLEAVIQSLFNLLIHLSTYAMLTNEHHLAAAYVAIAYRFKSFIQFARTPQTIHYYQRLLFLKHTLFIMNNDYENALDSLRQAITICFREFYIMINYDDELIVHQLLDRPNVNKEMFVANFVNLSIIFYQRGVCYEKEGKLYKAIESYKQAKWITNKYINSYEQEISVFFKWLETRICGYHRLLEIIQKGIEKRVEGKKKVKKKDMIIKEQNELQHYGDLSRIQSTTRMRNDNILKQTTAYLSNNNILQDDIDISSFRSKYPKSKYLTSTMKVIDNLLNVEFTPIVMKMKKIDFYNFENNTTVELRKQMSVVNQQKLLKKGNELQQQDQKPHYYKTKLVIGRNANNNSTNNIFNHSINNHQYQNKPKPETVEKFPFDKTLRAKSYLKRKKCLLDYNQKEIVFHKKMLDLKRFEPNDTLPRFSPGKETEEVNSYLNGKLSLAKTKRHKGQFQMPGNNCKNNSIKEVRFSQLQIFSEMNVLKKFNRRCGNQHLSYLIGASPPKQMQAYDCESSNQMNFDMIRRITQDHELLENDKKGLLKKRGKIGLYHSSSSVF